MSYVDEKGQEHRLLSTSHGWKLRIEIRQTGKFVHEENGCKDVVEAMERDKTWSEKQAEEN